MVCSAPTIYRQRYIRLESPKQADDASWRAFWNRERLLWDSAHEFHGTWLGLRLDAKRRAKALLLPKSDAAYERCPAGFLFLFSKLEDPDEALYHTMTHPYDSSPLEDPDEQCYGDYCDYRDYRDESAAYTPAVSSRVDHSRVAPHLC